MFDEESYALWKIYAPSKYGLAIKTNFKRLKECFVKNDNVHFGIVEYINDKVDEESQTKISLSKKVYYEFEKELRAILYDEYYTSNEMMHNYPYPNFENGTGICITLETLIENIYLSPNAPEWFENSFRNMLIKFLGKKFDSLIIKSKLKDSI